MMKEKDSGRDGIYFAISTLGMEETVLLGMGRSLIRRLCHL